MQTEIGLIIATVVAAVLAPRIWTLRRNRPARSPRRLTRPMPAAKPHDAIAALMLDVLSLRDKASHWPAILAQLNPDDQPRLRTVLLELRWLHRDDPDTALGMVEHVCIEARQTGLDASRLELLEMSKLLAERPAPASAALDKGPEVRGAATPPST